MEIFTIMGFLTTFPLGAAIIGTIFIIMYLKYKTRSSIITAETWIIYSVYEYLMYFRILCSGECNIRIDLLLIYPILLVLSAFAIIIYFKVKRKSKIV